MTTPDPPYYAVIFTSFRQEADDGYGEMAAAMAELAEQQPGYLGRVSVRGDDGVGITVSYWRTEEDVRAFRAVKDHQKAQARGRAGWYDWYISEVARVERVSRFEAPSHTRS